MVSSLWWSVPKAWSTFWWAVQNLHTVIINRYRYTSHSLGCIKREPKYGAKWKLILSSQLGRDFCNILGLEFGYRLPHLWALLGTRCVFGCWLTLKTHENGLILIQNQNQYQTVLGASSAATLEESDTRLKLITITDANWQVPGALGALMSVWLLDTIIGR